MLCDYIILTLPPSELPEQNKVTSYVASGNKNIKVGIPKKYSVIFKNELGEILDYKNVNFSWNITSSEIDIKKVKTKKQNNTIELLVDDELLIGKKINLSNIFR